MTLFMEMYLATVIEHYRAFRNLGIVLSLLGLLTWFILAVLFGVDGALVATLVIICFFMLYCLSAVVLGIMFFLNDSARKHQQGKYE